jgi:hypothetical protein
MKTASFLAVFILSAFALGKEPLVLEKTISLPNVDGRFDHFSVDVAGGRLAVAALGNNTVEVFDLHAGTRLTTIAGQKKPCGVLFVPGKSRLLVVNGGDGTVRAFETAKFQRANELSDLDDADNVRAEASRGHAIVGFGEGALAVINETGEKLLGKVPLAAHPESFQIESKSRRAYVNVPGAKHVAVVDLEKQAVVATWPLEKWRANFPMSLDEENGRLFIGCRSPARLLALDARSGALLGECEIAGDTDDLFFDAKRSRIYVSCGEGFLDTVQVDADGKLGRIAHQPTRVGARTCSFSPELDRLYLAVPRRGSGKDAELRIYRPSEHE